MPQLTQPQILALWLVATSKRSALQSTDPNAILLVDDAKLLSEAGVDTSRADVDHARNILKNDARLANARALFVDMITALNYTPPECPPKPHLTAISAMPPA